MIDYTDQSEVKAKFLALAAEKPFLSQALNDPLIDTNASLISQVVMSFNHRLDRAEQEQFLMSATNRSTVLAKAEDRQYTPAKAIPSAGPLTITDVNKAYGGIPSGIVLVSGGSVIYTTKEAATFDADGVAVVSVNQSELTTLDYSVDITRPFFEITIPSEYSSRIVEIRVYVDMGAGLELWDYKKRFRNVTAGQKAYDEFYNSSDEFGIRFGTNIVGLVPNAGNSIRVELFLTDGETTLISGEKLKPLDALQYSGIKFVASSAIVGGSAQEDTESIRINSLYYDAFDEQYVWADDYKFFLKRNMPTLTWVNFWGERHQELINGSPDLNFMNKIYISAYEPDGLATETDVMALANTLSKLNKDYVFVTPAIHTFTITISAIAMRNKTLADAKKVVHDWLISQYGKDSKTRKDQPFKRDIYEGIRELKVFDKGFEVEVSLAGKVIPENYSQLICLDEAATLAAITVSYA